MADDAGVINEVLAETSFLYGGNAAFVEDLYAQWAADPNSVEPSWRAFFATLGDRAEEVKRAAADPAWARPGAPIPVPTIVFHGDNDRTVAVGNASSIVGHAVASRTGSTLRQDATSGEAGGRRFSRTVYADARNDVVAEHWVVHGAGHAWSGGSTAGTFADARGPDASREIIRFLFAVRRAGTA